MSQEKMGTHYAREICQTFRAIADKITFEETKSKLVALADDLEPIVKKLYFKTQKGTEEMEEFAEEVEALEAKLVACQTAEEAESVFKPLYEAIGKSIHTAKTMKVRMT